MTITKIKSKTFTFEAIPESLEKTNLANLVKNSKVNLEPALKLNQDIDGHLVLGHIDDTAKVISLKNEEEHIILKMKTPKTLKQYITHKGSISINGVSLTISNCTKTSFSVDLIPHTLKLTNLSNLKKDDRVNIEIDMIARYLKGLLNESK